MKKTLSILLSLLMVLGTMTCLFTSPVTTASAEEASTDAESTVETLPVNDFINNNGTKTITTGTTWTIKDYTFANSVTYGICGWNAKYDDDGNLISGQANSYIDTSVRYQLTFDVTASEDINEGVKLAPSFYSNATPQKVLRVVGMRSNSSTPDKAETAYNYTYSMAMGSPGDDTNLSVDNAATLVAGQTYTYTYVFVVASDYVNHIRLCADGLTAGTVTLSAAKVFPISETDASNFLINDKWIDSDSNDSYDTIDYEQIIYYAVEEDGKVFTRMYPYNDIGNTTLRNNTISAVYGGDYYNLDLLGGNTYELDFDIRVSGDTALSYAPHIDFYETGAIDVAAMYANVKDSSDTSTQIKTIASNEASQRQCGHPSYGYSYFWANSGSSTYNRRVGAYARMDYTQDGATVWGGTEGGSAQGRNAMDTIRNVGWMDGTYTLDAIGAQTLEEAATLGAAKNASSNSCMRYTYANGAWTYNSAYNNLYVSAEQDVKVALGMSNIYTGTTYDFDNFSLKSSVEDVTVEYKNADGETDTLANTGHNATKYYDVFAGKTYAEIDLFESDTVIFNGWYNGDEFISTDEKIELEGDTSELKAVFTSKNLLPYAGGFDNYTATSTNLESEYVEVSKGCTAYPDYTAGTFRYYKSVPPTGDKWTGWDTNMRSSSLTDSDSGETSAKIIADIEAAGGVMNTSGYTGFTYFKGFPTVKGAVTETIYADSGNHSSQKQSVYVTPYSGDKMLHLQASARTAIRALEGLTTGKTYTVSFYVFNPYKDYWLKEVTVRTQPNLTADSTVLASYTEPFASVTEDRVTGQDATTGDLTTTSKTFPRITNMDHVQNWFKVELTFKATNEVAYLTFYNQIQGHTGGHTFIDELTMVEYDCNGNHLYDNVADTDCNVCGEARVYSDEFDFENGKIDGQITYNAGTLEVVDAVDQAEKIGDKYLQYTTTGFHGMTFNFEYDCNYKYKVSYDFKVFTYGTGTNANGIDHGLWKYDDGKYGVSDSSIYGLADTSELDEGYQTDSYRKLTAASLNKAEDNIVTRYYEDGTIYEKISTFTHSRKGEGSFYGTASTTVTNEDGTTTKVWGPIADTYGGSALWDSWQHVEIEIGNDNEYTGLVEFGIRPNDAGWVVGIDNFKVEKVAQNTIDEADNATNGTYAFNIRAKTSELKQGLRFKSTIDLDSLNLTDGAKIVEYGTLASKTSNVEAGYLLRREIATDKLSTGKTVAGVAYSAEDGIDIRYALDESTNSLTYTGVLTGIGVKNYDVDFTVCGYVIIENADGIRTTVYDDAVTLSVYDAATQIVEANQDADDVAIAQTVIDTYDAYVAATAE